MSIYVLLLHLYKLLIILLTSLSCIFYKTVNLEKTFTLSYATRSAQCRRRAAGLIKAKRRHLLFSTWIKN